MNQLTSITPLEIILIALAAVGIFFFFRACWRIIKRSRQHLSVALLTLVMTLTAQTAWADNINVETAAGFGTLTDGKYTLVNGNTYTLTGNINTDGYIYVPEGVTATIDLAGHTIDRGLTSADNNGTVIIVAGTLTITDSGTDGKIQGGYDGYAEHGFYVSGVEVQNGATFNLQGGTLVGRNQDYDYTVAVYDNGSFTMTGGKITEGWTGVQAGGNVTLTGGEISGNSNSGVLVDKNFSISGNPVITGNTVMNVDLVSSGQKKIIITGALTEGANIGITAPRPTDNSPVTVTSGYGTYNSEPVSTYFSLDNNGQIQISPYDYMTVVMGWNEDKTEIAVGTALYTVNFDMNGHGDAIDAVSLLSGYKVAEPTKPTADDWFFVGWFTDDACTSQWNFNNAVTSNMTLHALWAQEAIYSFTLPEKMVIVSTTNAPVGGKYPVGTVIKFKVSSADYVVDGDVSDGTNTLTPDGDGIYTVTMGETDITITATIKKAVEPNKTLSGSESYEAQNGDVLTGSTSGTVTIAADAKITLSDVTITGGIVCEGSAEITLVGTNSVTGASQKAGIQVGGSDTMLTIKGNGSLTANGGSQSAGIGLSRAWKVNATGGDILIESGNITATGNDMGAGIGTGVCWDGDSDKTAMLGNITIKGGTVRAIGGTNNGNGIGKGHAYVYGHAVVGTITIYDTIDKVDASSISESVTYMHVENETETDVTANKYDYFSIIEDGNRRVIELKDDTDYTITISNGIEHGTLTGAATAKYMEEVTITATPDFGYRLSRLVVKDAQNNDVASTGNSFFMPKSNVTVSAVFEQGTHGTTEFAWGYQGNYYQGFVTEATIYDGVTTVNLQQGKEYYIGKDYHEDPETGRGYYNNTFRLDEDPYAGGRDIPYSGGTGSFMMGGYGKFRLNGDAGFYDITMTDVGNGKWNVSILKTAGQMDVVPDQTYTGSEIKPEPLVIAGSLNLTKGTDYVYSYTNNTNVGTAKVIATFQGDYVSLGSVEKEFTIVKATPIVNAPTAVENLVYKGSAQALVNAGSTDFGTLLYSLDGENYSADIPTGTDAGTYTIYYKVEGSDNWNAVAAQTIQATILPSTVVVNVTGNGTVTYNDKSAASGEAFGVAAEKGTDVTLTLAPESGYAVSIEYGYTKSNGMTMNGAKLPINGTTATLTVPNNMKDGTYVNLTVTFVSALAGGADEASAVALTDATVTDLGGGWYKVDSDITFDHTLNLLGDTHLIIDNGKTMTVNTASNHGIDSEYTLNVSGEGALNITTTEAYKIAVRVGSYVQTGATVTANGYIGIRCKDNFDEFNVTNDFTFSGGQLTATGTGGNGIWADNDITLSCTNATDFIQASSYSSAFGAVKIAEGNALTDGTEASNGMNGYSGTLTYEQRTAIGGKTLHRAVTTSYVEASGTLHENVIAIPLDDTMTTLAAGWYVVNSNVAYTGQITLNGDVNLILGDGKKMTVTNTGTDVKDRAIYGDEKTLHIYGQSQGTGALTATAVGGESAIFLGISDDNAGSLLGIHGGVVSASTECASGVAISVQCATDAGGIVIDGGQVTASGKSYGIFCFSGHFDVIGGQVTATGTNGYGLGICDYGTNPGVLTLGYSKASDFVSTNSIYNYSGESSAGEVKIADDQTLVDGNGNIWSGTLSNDEIQSIRNQTLRPVTGVALTKDDKGNISATFDGTLLETVNIPGDVTVNAVTLKRSFSAGKASTVMLPFDYTCDKADGGVFYDFVDVKKDEQTNQQTNQWVATMKEVNQLKANTPYMFVAANDIDGITFTLPEKVTLNTTGGGECQKADAGSHWTFKGTYSYIKWTSNTEDKDYTKERADEIGKVYGFAGEKKDDIKIKLGDFVKAASGARIRPLTCYLIWNDTPNNTRSMTRGTIDELPSSIVVRLLSNVGPGNQDDDDNQGGTTAIGTLDTETGEIDFGGWYDMSGRKLSAKPTQKGLYINNGKKVIIK